MCHVRWETKETSSPSKARCLPGAPLKFTSPSLTRKVTCLEGPVVSAMRLQLSSLVCGYGKGGVQNSQRVTWAPRAGAGRGALSASTRSPHAALRPPKARQPRHEAACRSAPPAPPTPRPLPLGQQGGSKRSTEMRLTVAWTQPWQGSATQAAAEPALGVNTGAQSAPAKQHAPHLRQSRQNLSVVCALGPPLWQASHWEVFGARGEREREAACGDELASETK